MKSVLPWIALVTCVGAAGAPRDRPGGPCAAASGASSASGMCSGASGAERRRGPRWTPEDVPGWPMMTREERRVHRERMASFQTYEECHSYVEQHHRQMQARAKDRGHDLPSQPPRDACAPLKSKAASAP